MRIETYHCDAIGCDARTQEKQKNGWLVVTFNITKKAIYIEKDTQNYSGLWKDPKSPDFLHLDCSDVCGAACAQKKLSELLPRLS